MARPRSFDLNAALDAATALFWARGYDAVGLTDLLDAMGILRGSLYKAWGSKKGLFLACLARYDALYVAPGIDLLEGRGEAAAMSGQERIAAAFTSHDPRGCLLCNTAAGAAGTDDELALWVRGRLQALEAAFAAALAQDAPAGADLADEAERLTQQYVGMRVGQRTGSATGPA